MVQWLGLLAFAAKGLGLIPGQGTKIPQAARHSQREKKKKKKESRVQVLNPRSDFSLHYTMLPLLLDLVANVNMLSAYCRSK